MTAERINELYNELEQISVGYLIYQRRDNVELVKKRIALIQEFVTWIMQENQFGIEQDLYEAICQDLLKILQDILEALQHEDKVLMHDTIAYGLKPYLECFMEDTVEGK